MRRFSQFWSAFVIALHRLWSQRGLAASMLFGLAAAVALTVSIPIYADAISHRILSERLYSDPDDTGPPFGFLIRYIGSWSGYLEWEDCASVDQFITTQAASILALPQDMLVRHFKTDKMRLLPASEGTYVDKDKPLAYVSLGFMSDLESHIEIVDGRFPEPVTNNTDPTEVLITFPLVEKLGLQPGETYRVYSEQPQAQGSTVQRTFQHQVRIAGVWKQKDPNDPYWFYRQSAFDEVMLMPEASYVQMALGMKGEVGAAIWHLVCNGENIRSADIGPLITRIAVLRNKTGQFLKDIDFARSPYETLTSYTHTVQLLTIVLYAFGLPILGLVLYFITLIAAMIVDRQRNQVAMLRSRGATDGQVVGIYLTEGLIIAALAVPLGAFLGERFAQVMGSTRSFLVLEPRPFLPTMLSWTTLRFGLVAVGISILATTGPALRAARTTIMTYKQEQARTLYAPIWQRTLLDFLLLAISLYGYYTLKQRGTISILAGGNRTDSPFSNPFLFLVPVIFVFALALLAIRFFPILMRLFAALANAWRGVVPVLVLRQLSRVSRQYTGPLLLLILTLSLAVFTASMALTLDNSIVARAYYDVGADFRLIEVGETTETGSGAEQQANSSQEDQGPAWLFLPVSEHLSISGVQAAARVWKREANAQIREQSVKVQMMGIDRIDFPRVAFFRSDFAPASMGALMNALAVRNDAILVSRDILDQGITVGDKIEIAVPLGTTPKVKFAVAGVVDLFPGVYPEDGPFCIANLDYIFDVAGGMYPYDVWLKTEPTVIGGIVANEARKLGITVLDAFDTRDMIDRVQLAPERQGVFGLLSVGFVVSAVLTVLGFLIYSYVSFQRRYIELGVLRATGLSTFQMAAWLIIEQLALILIGVILGTGLGILVSGMFIPFMQVEAGKYPFTPPFVVQIAWQEITYIYILFGAMFLAAVIVLLLLLRRVRIFQAIKLGESV